MYSLVAFYSQVGSDSVSCNSAFSIFEIYVSLTSTGVCNWPFVVAILYEYIHLNRELGPQEWVFDELKKMAQIEYGMSPSLSVVIQLGYPFSVSFSLTFFV
mgnify:CR=1 FL=1